MPVFVWVRTAASIDPQVLLQRLDQLEKRVQQLEAELKQARSTQDAAQPPSPAVVAETAVATQIPSESPTIGGAQGLRIRAFGQASLIADDLKGDRPLYNAGNFTLLLNSRLSDKISAIAEIALDEEGYGSPEFKTVLERALIQYDHNEYFKIAGGRYFSSIGYYNTAYYNADWAQTTMRRPIISAFQDEGGLAPMQRNGITIGGRIPSGSLNLHYAGEVGGGDNQRADILGLGYEFPMQARVGYNVALFARPAKFQGLQVGGSFFHDSEIPLLAETGNPLVRQSVATLYAVYSNPKWEFLNEMYYVRHNVQGYRTYNVPAFYTQISHRLTPAIRPYFRFSYLNAGNGDPLLPDLGGRLTGYESGVRYNFSEWVGLKFEYDRMNIKATGQGINLGGTQLVFTF